LNGRISGSASAREVGCLAYQHENAYNAPMLVKWSRWRRTALLTQALVAALVFSLTMVAGSPAASPDGSASLNRQLQLDNATLSQLNVRRSDLQRQVALLERVIAQQSDSKKELNDFRQGLIEDGVIDALGLASNEVFLRKAGLTREAAAKTARVIARYHAGMNFLSANNAGKSHNPEDYDRAVAKGTSALLETGLLLAQIKMPSSTYDQISKVVESAHAVFEANGNLNGAQTRLQRASIVVDGFTRYAAALDPRLAALRSGGDLAAGGYLYAKLVWDQQSVDDATYSAQYALGLVRARIDKIDRQRKAVTALIQRDNLAQRPQPAPSSVPPAPQPVQTAYVAPAPISYEEITLQNYSPFQLELNVDGSYGCTASANPAWVPSTGRSWAQAPPPRCTARVIMAAHTITVINASDNARPVIKQRSLAATESYTDSECYGDFWFNNPGATCP